MYGFDDVSFLKFLFFHSLTQTIFKVIQLKSHVGYMTHSDFYLD